MKFYEWLRYQRHREDGVGDFARDVFWDDQAPKDSEDPETWRAYAKKRGLPFLLAGFEQAWKEFLDIESCSILALHPIRE